jgi:zinc transport system substrate-binding protein
VSDGRRIKKGKGMVRKIIFGVLVLVLCAAILFMAVSRSARTAKTGIPHRMKVITTLFPLYDMARHIGAEKADVSLLLPPGVEAHSFEPRPSDIVRINEADIFVYTGRAMEPWAEDISLSVTNRNLLVVNAGRGTRMIPASNREQGEPPSAPDPHIWLDFDNAKIMAGNIEAAFETKDPANKDFYRQKLNDYRTRLSEVDAAYRGTLSHCTNTEIVYGGHYALGYLAHRYGLRYMAAQGVSPDSEPTAKDLENLVVQIRRNHIRFIFYEEISSPKIAQTIAAETDTKLLPLSAAHNVTRDQFEKGVTFFDILNTDLKNLKTGLGCK